MKRICNSVIYICLFAALLGLAGCKSHPTPPLTPPVENGPGPGPGDTNQPGALPNVNVGDLPFTKFDGMQNVYFDYNSAVLLPDAIKAIKANADRIQQVPECMIRVEGHCDERGTQEYNLALGERRALAVREALTRFGVPGTRIITLSYGEEMPAMQGHTEAAWKMNRRCEFSKSTPK